MKRQNKVTLFFSILLCCATTVVLFQNCGAPMHGMAVQSSDMNHSDQNHWETRVEETTYSPNLVDRFYIMSLFKDVFGPNAVTVDSSSTGSAIYTRLNEFGTPCTAYEDYRILNGQNRVRARTDRTCVYGDRSDYLNANIIPTATASREGYLVNICTSLVENTTTLNYALKKISGLTTVPPVNRDRLTKLYAHFYRGRPEPAPGIVDSLEMIFQYEANLTKAWKAAIYSVCASGQWQVL